MSYQEPEMYHEIQELAAHGGGLESAALHRFAMLHLNPITTTTNNNNNNNHHHHHLTATTKPRGTKLEKCSQCGTMKRRSPLASKNTATTTIAATDGGSHQSRQDNATTFNNIVTASPPSSSNTKEKQLLHRSISEPIYFEETQIAEASKAQEMSSCAATGQYFNPLSPENSKTGGGTSSPSPSPAMASLPPLPPPLRRTLSEPTAADPQGLVVAATTSPPCQAARTVKRSPVSEDSPDSKRLKRMKERMKEMSHWWGQVMHEENEDFSSEDNNSPINLKDESENEHEEAVWVEKHGEGLVIHFNCPCGKGYGIFLYGNNCYYKLM